MKRLVVVERAEGGEGGHGQCWRSGRCGEIFQDEGDGSRRCGEQRDDQRKWENGDSVSANSKDDECLWNSLNSGPSCTAFVLLRSQATHPSIRPFINHQPATEQDDDDMVTREPEPWFDIRTLVDH